jgi:hypothetical protein
VSTLTLTQQATWPPRNLLAASGITPGAEVIIYRVQGGTSEPVRGANGVTVTGTALVVIDAEMSFGLNVTYVLVEGGTFQDQEGPVSMTLPGGKVALTDAITGLSAEVVILAHDERIRDNDSTVYLVDGKNRVVAARMGQYRCTYEYYCETTTASNDLQNLLENATSGIILQRAPSVVTYAGVDDHLSVLGSRERRWSQDGSDERRVWAVQVAQCDGWPPSLEARGFTLQDVADAYFGDTLADFDADYATLLDAAQGDYS